MNNQKNWKYKKQEYMEFYNIMQNDNIFCGMTIPEIWHYSSGVTTGVLSGVCGEILTLILL
jgi:hypothetical protein